MGAVMAPNVTAFPTCRSSDGLSASEALSERHVPQGKAARRRGRSGYALVRRRDSSTHTSRHRRRAAQRPTRHGSLPPCPTVRRRQDRPTAPPTHTAADTQLPGRAEDRALRDDTLPTSKSAPPPMQFGPSCYGAANEMRYRRREIAARYVSRAETSRGDLSLAAPIASSRQSDPS